jgi:hypothetical protein
MSVASDNFLSIVSVRMKEKESIKVYNRSCKEDNDIFFSLCLDKSGLSKRTEVKVREEREKEKSCLMCRVF